MKDQPSILYLQSMNLESESAPLFVRNFGSQQCSPNQGWGPGVRNHFLLFYIMEGKGVYICNNKRYELRAGDTFLVYPDKTIYYYADAQQPWKYIWVGFGGPEAAKYMEKTDFSPEKPVYIGRDSEKIYEHLIALQERSGVSAHERLAVKGGLYKLLSFLVETTRQKGEVKEEPDCAHLAAEYIVSHYEDPITVEALAAYVGVSHSSLYRRFIKHFQISPKRFLLEYRVARACDMLANPGLSVQEISNSVGFEDPFYFSRAFKDIKGVSPRQYANAVRSGQV